jgi:hypothetical protein
VLDRADAAIAKRQQRQARQLHHGVGVVVQHIAQAVLEQEMQCASVTCTWQQTMLSRVQWLGFP